MRRQERADPSKARPLLRELPEDQLKQILADHRAWLESDGQRGLKANLSHAQLQGFSLWSADLREADLCYARLQGRTSITLACGGANLRHAQMEGASLWQASLRGADLSFAGLQRAKLDHADFSGANLHKADLAGASLWGAQLSGARLGDAVGLTDDQLKNAHLA